MKRVNYILAISLLMGSCASLTKTQIHSVNQFAQTTREFSAFPGKIMTELADIRVKRSIYYVNSFSDPKLHIEELDSIYSQKIFDYRLSQKVDITFKIIDRYAQSLFLLSSDKYLKEIDKQGKDLGIDIDSLITLNNSIEGATRIPSGIGAAVSKLIVLGGKQYIKVKQAKEIKKYVSQADTLISVMSANLLEHLQSKNIDELIKNEERAIKRSYLSYLQQINTETRTWTIGKTDTLVSISGTKSTIDNDRDYLDLKNRIDGVKQLRQKTIKATIDLRKAHKKLLREIQEKKDLKQSIKELKELHEEINDLNKTVQRIDLNK